jgi:hypothetical protein
MEKDCIDCKKHGTCNCPQVEDGVVGYEGPVCTYFVGGGPNILPMVYE